MLQSLQILGLWQCLPGKLYNLEIATALLGRNVSSFMDTLIFTTVSAANGTAPRSPLHPNPETKVCAIEVCLRQHCVMETTKAIQTRWKHMFITIFISYIYIYSIHISWKQVLRRSTVKKNHKPSIYIYVYIYCVQKVLSHHLSTQIGSSSWKLTWPSGSHNWQSAGGAKGAAHLATHLKIEDQADHQYSWWFRNPAN